jgi:hypothetical protein
MSWFRFTRWFRWRHRRGRSISLLVPFRPDTEYRARVWSWLQDYWRHELPGAEIVMGRNDDIPFSKTSAVNDAFRKAHGDIIVILDADCYIPGKVILGCARRIRQARRRRRRLWFIPYRHFYRLTQEATRRVLLSDPRHPLRFSDPPPPEMVDDAARNSGYGHWFGALIQIMPREAFIAAGGMDERFCVDEATQILTRDGWKSRADLSEGERILTLNHGTGLSEWQPVLAVNSFDGEHEMLSIESKTHSSLTTLNHRWPVIHRPDYRPGTGWGSIRSRRTWTTSAGIRDSDTVPTAAVCADLPAEAKYSDDLVALVAWFWTEGSITRLRDGRPGRGVVISQSLVVNPENCERIRACLTGVFGPASAFPRRGKSPVPDIPRWREREDRRNAVFVLNAEAGELMQQHAPGRVPSHAFLLDLTSAQLDLFISVSLLADGHERARNCEVSLSQKDPAAAEAFQFACILAGDATSTHTAPAMEHYGYGMTTVRVRQQRGFRLVKGEHRNVTHVGTVWCPTTPNGTWLARRNDRVYFTGNSGWGGDDIAFMTAVDTLYTSHRTTPNGVLHLWHPHKGVQHFERMWEGQEEPGANDFLSTRYADARGRSQRMLRLTREPGTGGEVK